MIDMNEDERKAYDAEKRLGRVRVTLSGEPPRSSDLSAPGPIDPKTGMHEDYWVFSAEERAKGFVRPVRTSYVHVGRRVCGKPSNEAPPAGYAAMVCVMVPGHDGECLQWSGVRPAQFQRLKLTGYLGGCGTVTTMARAFAETYARDPKFYGATFCAGDGCRTHFPVGEHGEFVWDGTDERVGT